MSNVIGLKYVLLELYNIETVVCNLNGAIQTTNLIERGSLMITRTLCLTKLTQTYFFPLKLEPLHINWPSCNLARNNIHQ